MNVASDFLTPPRILIPKLVASRDAWKEKATQRKQRCKALQIRVRDLEASRESHRARAELLAGQVRDLQAQIEQLHAQPCPVVEAAPKNSRPPKAAITPSA